MAEEIIYDSEEVLDAANTLGVSEKLFNSDVKNSLASDFTFLDELGFTGVGKLKQQNEALIYMHNSVVNDLKDHDTNMIDFETKQKEKIQELLEYKLEEKEEVQEVNVELKGVELGESNLGTMDQGISVKTTELSDIMPELSYSGKKDILLSIVNYQVSSMTGLLTDSNQSNILAFELKQVLNDNSSDISTIATDEEKDLQKALVESLASEKENIFREVEEDTFLRGMPYYKKIADLNNLPVSDLLIDEKNNKLLTDCVDYVCGHNGIDGMDASDIASVKNYISSLAESQSTSVASFLSNSNNAKIIRGGNKL